MNEITPELRDKLETFLIGKPSSRPLIDRLLRKHAEANSDKERAGIVRLLQSVVQPSRVKLWLALGMPAFMIGLFALILVSERRHEAAVRAGAPATAQVVRQDEGSCLVGDKGSACLRLALRVYPASAPPYDAVLEESIPNRFLSRVQPGSWLTVSVNRQDRTQVLFDAEAMAVASPPPVGSAR